MVKFKLCGYFQNGKCQLMAMLTGEELDCIRKSNCVNLKMKRGYKQ